MPGTTAQHSHYPETYAQIAEWAAERFGELPALRHKTADGWRDQSYLQLRDTVRTVGCGLIGGLGVQPDDRIAILCETRPEWTHAQLGVLAAGAVVVPLYPSAGDEEATWVLTDSSAGVVVCETPAQAARIERLRPKLPALRQVVCMTGAGEGDLDLYALPDPAPLDALLDRMRSRTNDDLYSIMYTSGTTGMPKGCRLTFGNLGAVRDSSLDLWPGGPDDCNYLYLPLAHLLAQLIALKSFHQGSVLCYFGGRIEDVVGELAEAKPTYLPSVPRLFEKVYGMVLAAAEAQGPEGPQRLAAAVRVGVEVARMRAAGKQPEGELLAQWSAADQTLFEPVRQVFGGRLRAVTTAAAPIAPQAFDFLVAMGLQVFEAYGMTESAGIITMNHPGAMRYGTVGRPVSCNEVRIAEDGEVLARGANVFAGYHGQVTQASADGEAVDADGWLHTGDLGELDPDGYLIITGRKKELIITSGGKNLTPSLTEFALQRSRWISRAVMIGDRRPYPVALITLDREEVDRWLAQNGGAGTEHPAHHPAVRALVQEAVDAANAEAARPARIRDFAILEDELSVDSGELTPTFKLRRMAVAQRHAAVIDALYEKEAPGARTES